jgi:hypothetical protein
MNNVFSSVWTELNGSGMLFRFCKEQTDILFAVESETFSLTFFRMVNKMAILLKKCGETTNCGT